MNQTLLTKIIQDNDERADAMNKHFYNRRCPSDSTTLNLLNIKDDDKNNVKVYDEQDNLELYHYVDCRKENTWHIRGTIINKETKQIVCRSLPFIMEFSLTDFSSINLPDDTINSCIISESHEGTIVRFFNDNNKWIMSTHKNINGGDKRWNSDNFQTLFNECLQSSCNISQEDFEKQLNPKYCYNFLINHPKNSLVCTYSVPKLYLIAVFEGSKRVETDVNIHKLGIQELVNHKFTSTKDFIDHVNNSDWTTISGFYVNFPSHGIERIIKVVHDEYFIRKQLIGNQVNKTVRYFDLKQLGVTCDIMTHYDSNNAKLYTDIENKIINLKRELWRIFQERYFNNHYEQTTTEKHILIKTVKDDNQKLVKNKDIKLKQLLEKTVDEYKSWYLYKMLQ